MSGPSFDRVIDALRQVALEAARPSGAWRMFHCPVPAHGQGNGDRNPSLGVKYDPEREKTIVNCFGQCPQEDVLDAANLHVRDLFDHLPERTDPTHQPRQATTDSRPARRVIVTGSRTWTDKTAIRNALARVWGPDVVLVSGGASGADQLCEQCWTHWGGKVEQHLPEWKQHGREAGLARNRAMVAAGADVCLAFIKDQSAGASHTATLAHQAGIPVRRIDSVTHEQRSPARPASGAFSDQQRPEGTRAGRKPPPPASTEQPRTVPAAKADLGECTGPRQFVAAYNYTDTRNAPIGQVLRYAVPHEHGVKKTFSQRRWDRNQRQWVPGGFEGDGAVLYRAPIVAWAIREQAPILVCEGEKDVDRAIEHGYPATCNAGGAGRFGIEHAFQLAGAAQVVVIADRDKPGFAHAAKVHDHLRSLVGKIDVRLAAVGKDLSDHFDAGKDLADLQKIDREQLGEVRLTPAEIAARDDQGLQVLIHGLAPEPKPVRPNLDWGLDR